MSIKELSSSISNKLLEINLIDKTMNKINGFGFVGSDSLWDAKKVIATDMVKTLTAYKKFIISGNSYSNPTWMLKEFETIDAVSDHTLKTRWINCLDEMILGFQLENNSPINMGLEERLQRQQRALILFHQHYFHLWD